MRKLLILIPVFCVNFAFSQDTLSIDELETDTTIQSSTLQDTSGFIVPQYSVDELVNYAKSYLGTPHKMGGTTKSGIDCSGLVKITFREFRIVLPHSADDQVAVGKKISTIAELEKGDIVFFKNTYNTTKFITHSGIYLGNEVFIHTSASQGVIITSITESHYWNSRFVCGTRIR